MFILFASLPEKELDWNDQGVAGTYRFLRRLFALAQEKVKPGKKELNSKDRYIITKTHSTIKKVTEYIESFKYNLAIGALMEFVGVLQRYKERNKTVFDKAIEKLILMLTPFAPHIAEELWEKTGHKGFVSLQKWPVHDKTKIDAKTEAGEELIDKTKKDVYAVMKLTGMTPKEIDVIVSEKWKYSFMEKMREQVEKTMDVKEVMKAVMDKEHGKDIAKMVPALIKDREKMPDVVLDQKTEMDVLEEAKKDVEEEFNAKIIITKAEDSKEGKAKQAMPGKPAIMLK